jgi:hypothetical protein
MFGGPRGRRFVGAAAGPHSGARVLGGPQGRRFAGEEGHGEANRQPLGLWLNGL